MNRDRIEFYREGERGHIAVTDSSHAPDRGDKVNIKGVTYMVLGRTYTVDQSDNWNLTSVVCVITLGPLPDEQL